MITQYELNTAYGTVHWCVLPVKNHLDTILSILSTASGMELSRVDMRRTPDGRPEFPACGFDANWTHSKDICVLAYSFTAKVGVDIEKLRPRALRIAERFFAKEETDLLFRSNLAPDESLRQFYRIWCRKEAVFKCVGGSFLGGVLSTNVLTDEVNGAILADIQLPLENPFAATIAVAPLV
ncbi:MULTISPECIES: 4'-phosphopantetheinyl transferase superfamily protein [Hallerella]|uniref:4'-phosphopantetheinyl transferase superfamily protein n=1 Tax=Hallerella succinigenes TaxID=1896222 RepID=A0A2M9A563_9BACT|nr:MULTISPECIES: 4'-phosphopantetheinyl transferase superfamily protein [Hallerella]MCI6874400.1 4'-phosphopantetheinyl transferase superfamily protein [Hallerella sp.]MDD6092813.1 4'-phosphopantetheinyl transferase superfamily protein [Hallerella succinigenes]MDY5029017.1 4'-phosphopantetheinyl transferase superfamily protein [Hallerella succinigenes]PJJ40861.1 4'-phosphopantetheinyl transferase superfamily protein [Hallerella succinigenes]